MITCEFEDGGKGLLRHVVVDSLVFKDGKILLVKRSPHMLEGGKWGLVGGYVDRDETTRGAAAREVLEETGWTAKDYVLLAINDNPDRPKEDRQNVALVFFCQAVEKIGEPDNESTEQTWFDLDKLPPDAEIAFDHLYNIDLYKKYLEQDFALPHMA